MRRGDQIDHERSGPKIVNRGLKSLRACGQHRLLKLSNGKLPVSLTKGDKSNSSGHQIGDITLQKGGQRQKSRNAQPGRTSSKHDG
jgi:hypothetical protein